MANIGAALGGGGALTQFFVWQVAGQIVQALMEPALTELGQDINSQFPTVALSPADLAQLVVRNFRDLGHGTDEAKKSGLTGDRFQDLVNLATEAPSPGDLAAMLRRGLIVESGHGSGSTSFEQGMSESRLSNKWHGLVKELAVQWPSPTDALDALLEGQVSQAEAETLYKRLGGDPQFFTVLYNTRGQAPTPVEALEMANRGIIPWSGTGPSATTYEQAFLEGPWRNKWLGPYKAIGQYLPPPRTVTAMVASGGLTDAQGQALLLKQGLSAELAAAYIHDAHNQKSSQERDLTVSQLLDMYGAGLISQADITPLLTAMRYSAESIAWLFAYRDLRRAIAATNQAVARIHTLYVGHKITSDTAVSSLNALKVPPTQVHEIVATWDIERATNLKVLTPTQIVDAWSADIIDEQEALRELVSIGYTPRDAWIVLSIKNKGPLDAPPAPGPAPLSPVPTPGGTK
jgi:hypothetical protein